MSASTFVHLNNTWQERGVLPTKVRKALITIGTTHLHADPLAKLVITVAKSLNIPVTEHIAEWKTGGGAIERNKQALGHCNSVLVITNDLKNERYGLNVLRQARTQGITDAYLLMPNDFTKLDMSTIPPFVYRELDSSPFVVTDPKKLDPSLFATSTDLS